MKPEAEPVSIEQMCRNLLEQAKADGLLKSRIDPQRLTAGDLCGMANLLQKYLHRKPAK